MSDLWSLLFIIAAFLLLVMTSYLLLALTTYAYASGSLLLFWRKYRIKNLSQMTEDATEEFSMSIHIEYLL